MQLRPYQQQAVTDLREAYRLGYRSALFVLPTGGGKTVVFAEIARAATAIGSRVLVLTHRSELLRQAHSKLTGLGIDAGIVYGVKHRYQHGRPVHVSSVQTMARQSRLRLFDHDAFDLIIIDEAHHAPASDWSKVLDHFSGARLLGVTATPIRTDGRGLRAQFDVMVKGPSPEWLTDAGFLSRARVFAPPVGFDPAKIKRRMGDFDRGECEEQLISSVILGDVVGHYRKHLGGRTAIAFCVSIDHAKAVAAEFLAQGIEAASIDGSLKADERETLLSRLGTGELKVLTSCDLIGEGVDVPSVAGCILLRPTQSLGLFLQMVGRCLRPKPDGSEAIVLDHVGNYQRHGHHLDERPWSLDGVEGAPKSKRQNEIEAASVWVCPSCFATNRSTDLTCIDCSSEKPDGRGAIHQESGNLTEVDHSRQMRLAAALERQEKRNRRREQGRAKSMSELIAIGQQRGMKFPYAWAKKVLAGRKRDRP